MDISAGDLVVNDIGQIDAEVILCTVDVDVEHKVLIDGSRTKDGHVVSAVTCEVEGVLALFCTVLWSDVHVGAVHDEALDGLAGAEAAHGEVDDHLLVVVDVLIVHHRIVPGARTVLVADLDAKVALALDVAPVEVVVVDVHIACRDGGFAAAEFLDLECQVFGHVALGIPLGGRAEPIDGTVLAAAVLQQAQALCLDFYRPGVFALGRGSEPRDFLSEVDIDTIGGVFAFDDVTLHVGEGVLSGVLTGGRHREDEVGHLLAVGYWSPCAVVGRLVEAVALPFALHAVPEVPVVGRIGHEHPLLGGGDGGREVSVGVASIIGLHHIALDNLLFRLPALADVVERNGGICAGVGKQNHVVLVEVKDLEGARRHFCCHLVPVVGCHDGPGVGEGDGVGCYIEHPRTLERTQSCARHVGGDVGTFLQVEGHLAVVGSFTNPAVACPVGSPIPLCCTAVVKEWCNGRSRIPGTCIEEVVTIRSV